MAVRWALSFIFGLTLIIIQMGLVASFYQPFSSINLILVSLIFLFFLNKKYDRLFYLIIWVGFLMELFNSSIFGLYLFTIFLTFLIITFISRFFLTNKTTIVLLVTSCLVFVFYNLIFVLLNFLISIKYDLGLTYSFLDYLRFGLIGAIVNLPLILIVNFLLKKFSGLFREFFIFN
ncbi:MAG TPA: hypothetical protein PKY08_01635 [Candidatus Magasanikbacteria bacterium]|nr:hypothetical protein [Candidatus Magasanikbacteria bacterium]